MRRRIPGEDNTKDEKKKVCREIEKNGRGKAIEMSINTYTNIHIRDKKRKTKNKTDVFKIK